MPTYELIEHQEVGASGATSLSFTSLPTDFTDLFIKLSLRSDASATYDPILLRFNGNTTGYSGNVVETSVGSFFTSEEVTTATSAQAGGTWARVTGTGVNTDLHTTGAFSNSEIYISNYRKSIQKSFMCETVGENNAQQAPLEMTANLWANTAAINSVSIALKDGNIKQFSSASLYGVRKYEASTAPKATGGIISYDSVNNKWVHTFTASGTFTPTENLTAEYLVIAGGGGGGRFYGGGGGAGGYRCSVSGESSGGGAAAETPLSLTASTGYTVTVGAGGAGGTSNRGASGVNSTFATITSTGGGGGGGLTLTTGANGGSGGGGSLAGDSNGSGTTDQGFDGGDGSDPSANAATGGGGGGAGSVGANSVTYTGGAGGAGITSAITGSSIARAGGGGGGAGINASNVGGSSQDGGGHGGHGNSNIGATDGTIATGGGGGGGSEVQNGKAGGSGIVIVRYAA